MQLLGQTQVWSEVKGNQVSIACTHAAWLVKALLPWGEVLGMGEDVSSPCAWYKAKVLTSSS